MRGDSVEPECGAPVWDGRYWCVLPVGHDGAHEAAPFGQQQPFGNPSGSDTGDDA